MNLAGALAAAVHGEEHDDFGILKDGLRVARPHDGHLYKEVDELGSDAWIGDYMAGPDGEPADAWYRGVVKRDALALANTNASRPETSASASDPWRGSPWNALAVEQGAQGCSWASA